MWALHVVGNNGFTSNTPAVDLGTLNMLEPSIQGGGPRLVKINLVGGGYNMYYMGQEPAVWRASGTYARTMSAAVQAYPTLKALEGRLVELYDGPFSGASGNRRRTNSRGKFLVGLVTWRGEGGGVANVENFRYAWNVTLHRAADPVTIPPGDGTIAPVSNTPEPPDGGSGNSLSPTVPASAVFASTLAELPPGTNLSWEYNGGGIGQLTLGGVPNAGTAQYQIHIRGDNGTGDFGAAGFMSTMGGDWDATIIGIPQGTYSGGTATATTNAYTGQLTIDLDAFEVI